MNNYETVHRKNHENNIICTKDDTYKETIISKEV